MMREHFTKRTQFFLEPTPRGNADSPQHNIMSEVAQILRPVRPLEADKIGRARRRRRRHLLSQ
jgi:hypothetical protein